jgi:hypothetical protein
VVVQGDALNRSRIATVVCLPLTSNLQWADAPGHVRLSARSTNLPKDSVAKPSQVVSVSDLFTLEHEISNAVSSALRVQPMEPEKKDLAEAHKVNPGAYDLYLRGLSHALRSNEQDIDQAITLLEKSAALDPTFVPAQAYLALAYGNTSSIYRPNDPQWEEKGFAAAQKALDLDAGEPE